ncbi:MAG: glycosyltransferase [Candidatus Marsarchaeota archaeon]|jgi:cellulose synthase (UDP-forming)|nr:glycosyltransferase [Candidatus Marsarchaeota archaeon]
MLIDFKYNKAIKMRLFTVALFIILSIAGVGFAFYLFYIANTIPMFLLAIAFMMLSLIAAFFNIYASVWYFRSIFYDDYLKKISKNNKMPKILPNIAIIVPTFNENPEILGNNILELLKMNYPKNKLKFYIADDSTNSETVSKIKEFATKYHIKFVHRNNRDGFKAGALNNILKISKEPYIAIFDADELLENKNFIIDLLPYFNDKKVSFVQTEKRYKKGSFFSDSVDIFDGFFFKFIEPARALNNTAVFAGSCGIIKRSILNKIGGFPEYIIEDTFFSFESSIRNLKSIYIPKVYARGEPIKTFTHLAKQQWRYNYGDTQFISYFLKKKNNNESPFSKLDYTTHGLGLNYISIMLILFTLVSAGTIFLDVPFAHIDIASFFTHNQIGLDLEMLGLFAFTLSVFTPVILTKIYFGSLKKGLMVFMLNFALAFVRTNAAISAIIKKNPINSWNSFRHMQKRNDLFTSIINAKTEIVFSTFLLFLAFIAFSESNLAGGIWLVGYSCLYFLTLIFFYVYG